MFEKQTERSPRPSSKLDRAFDLGHRTVSTIVHACIAKTPATSPSQILPGDEWKGVTNDSNRMQAALLSLLDEDVEVLARDFIEEPERAMAELGEIAEVLVDDVRSNLDSDDALVSLSAARALRVLVPLIKMSRTVHTAPEPRSHTVNRLPQFSNN